MRVSTVALLAFATLAASDLERQASAKNSEQPPSPSDQLSPSRTTSLSSYKIASESFAGISPPEILIAQNTDKPTRPIPQPAETPNFDLPETNLEQALEEGETQRDQQIDQRLQAIDRVISLLNYLAIILAASPLIGAVALFLIARKFVIQQLLQEVKYQLDNLGDIEKQLHYSHQKANQLLKRLEAGLDQVGEREEDEELSISTISEEEFTDIKKVVLQQIHEILQELQAEKDHLIKKVKQEVVLETPATETVTPVNDELATIIEPEVEIPPTAEELVRQADLWVQEERFEEALQEYQKALALQPDYYLAWFNQVQVLKSLERYEAALEICNHVQAVYPDQYELWKERGMILRKLHREQEALEAFDRAISLDASHPEIWYNRGNALEKLQEYQEACQCYQQATSLDANYHQAWHNQGVMLEKLQQDEKAIAAYDRSLAIHSDKHETWYNRGNALGKLGLYEEAIASYDRSLELKADKYEAWYNRGNILGRLQRYDEALVSYDQALSHKPDDYEAWYNRGNVLERLQRHEEAIASYERVIDINPEEHEAWRNRGILLEKLKRYDEALDSYEQAIELNPNDYEAWRCRGTVLAELQRYQEAIASFSKAMQIQQEIHVSEERAPHVSV